MRDIHGRHFEAGHNLQVPLIKPGRYCFLCLGHSRVVRCDFIES